MFACAYGWATLIDDPRLNAAFCFDQSLLFCLFRLTLYLDVAGEPRKVQDELGRLTFFNLFREYTWRLSIQYWVGHLRIGRLRGKTAVGIKHWS